ncbi:MAG: 5'/3'-nucleotidase SurE [Alphaproteobacteria bacterium]|nr:5'/3'-nucleotidase SurE [Alphaproteobacteria bacterium SS10]
MSYADPNRRILITNDDGIEAAGLACLARIAGQLANDVWTFAPASEASGVGHAMTLHRPLRIREMGEKVYTVDGTPTDCVLLAINDLLPERKPDLVLSGVNHGANIGDDVTYSGTIGAAMEATLLGIPAVALSLVYDREAGEVPNWQTAEVYGPAVIAKLLSRDWPRDTLINVNFPACEPHEVRGVKALRHGTRKIGDEIIHHKDPRGRSYTWIGPARSHAEEPARDTDVSAIADNFVTVTPIHLDLTNYQALSEMQGWFDDGDIAHAQVAE